MPVIFICFILFIMWFRVKSKKASKMEQNSKEDFLRREHEANLTRKKDISNLDYIVIPEEDLPFTETNDEEEAMLQDNLRKAMSKKILNLSGISNTDLNWNMDMLILKHFPSMTRILQTFCAALINGQDFFTKKVNGSVQNRYLNMQSQ